MFFSCLWFELVPVKIAILCKKTGTEIGLSQKTRTFDRNYPPEDPEKRPAGDVNDARK